MLKHQAVIHAFYAHPAITAERWSTRLTHLQRAFQIRYGFQLLLVGQHAGVDVLQWLLIPQFGPPAVGGAAVSELDAAPTRPPGLAI